MQRREFIKICALTGTGLLGSDHLFLSAAGGLAGRRGHQPDILLIMPDQMRGDCLSCLDHTAVSTPAMDKLAADGVLFRRAYSTVTSCIPARYAMLTGLYPQTSGVVGFRTTQFFRTPVPVLMNSAGYATALVGRNMHQGKPCGYQTEILGSTHVSNDDYDRHLKKMAPKTGGIKNLVKKMGLTYNHWQAAPWPLDNRLHPTEWIVARSREVVEKADAKRPLFLTASFYAPHPPLFPPREIFDRVKKRKLPAPARGDWVDWDKLSPKGDGPGHRVLLEGEVLHNAQTGYYGLIDHLDQQMALLIRDFKARSERAGRPWVIMLTTDHGEMMGDHGYFRKCEPYEGSANIPFIICGSSALGFKRGVRNNRPVCLEDVATTVLALAGAKSPAPLDGINLLPALCGQDPVIRKQLHFEHAPCYSQAQAYHALTDGRFKYIWRSRDGREHLFDLDKDPQELHDLAKVPACREALAQWRGRMAARLSERPEGFVKDGKLVPGRPYAALSKGIVAENRKRTS